MIFVLKFCAIVGFSLLSGEKGWRFAKTLAAMSTVVVVSILAQTVTNLKINLDHTARNLSI